jgi:hypothetical protein
VSIPEKFIATVRVLDDAADALDDVPVTAAASSVVAPSAPAMSARTDDRGRVAPERGWSAILI